jgi:hypothetical protein
MAGIQNMKWWDQITASILKCETTAVRVHAHTGMCPSTMHACHTNPHLQQNTDEIGYSPKSLYLNPDIKGLRGEPPV